MKIYGLALNGLGEPAAITMAVRAMGENIIREYGRLHHSDFKLFVGFPIAAFNDS